MSQQAPLDSGEQNSCHRKKHGCHNEAYAVDVEEHVVDDDVTDSEEEEDPWKVTSIEVEEIPWSELSCGGVFKRLCKYIWGIVLILAFLYMFICSLDFLSSAFKLFGGKTAGQVFQNSDILNNPVAGLMMGVLVTVLVQSSSTSTSIVISMVGADILTIDLAIPIVMGANIGTSVTNTIVALGQITNKADFRRAFAGATVHDMFNWLTVIVFLPIEVVTGYLRHLSGAIVNSFSALEPDKNYKRDLLKVITKPFTTLIIEVDQDIITKIAKNEGGSGSLMKTCNDKVTPNKCCSNMLKERHIFNNLSYTIDTRASLCGALNTCEDRDACTDLWKEDTFDCTKFAVDSTCCTDFNNTIGSLTTVLNETQKGDACNSLIASCPNNFLVTKDCMAAWKNESRFSCADWTDVAGTCLNPKSHLFMSLAGKIDDVYIGAILLAVSLVILCVCLVCIVKLLHTLLRGQIALVVKKFINANFPGKVCGYFTGYLAIILGTGLTILVQSSSIFTSTLTPLVGIGVIELDRMYPLTLGANIGTTTTGILSALAQDGNKIRNSLQVALCHLFFNLSGILVFYPFPFFRPPIPLAKFLGTTTAKYRWFAIVYLFAMFFLLPAAVFGLSIPGWYVLAAVLIPIAVIVIIIFIIKCIQRKRRQALPKKLQTWKWLPEPLRSLRPYDNVMQRVCCSCVNTEDKEKTTQPVKKDRPIANGHGAHTDTRL